MSGRQLFGPDTAILSIRSCFLTSHIIWHVNKILAKKFNIFDIVYLDDILIYTKNPGKLYVEAVCWVLDQLQKYSFFASLKQYYFYQDKVHFVRYVVSSKDISIEAKRIEVLKDWLKSKSVYNVLVFLDFTNFYYWFIQDFSKILALLISMLKTAELPDMPASIKNMAKVYLLDLVVR